jgi:hypothetical protein
MASLVDLVPCVALAVALAACAGLRAWLPLLLTGVLARAGLFELGGGFGFLASNKALAVFGLATAIELIGDKIPAVDHALDLLSTVLRPAAGALLAASVLGRVSDPLTALSLGVAIGAPAALVPHAAKAGLRAASTALTAGIANPILSVAEDAATVALFVAAVVVPLLVVLAMVLVGFLLLRRRRRPRATLQVS